MLDAIIIKIELIWIPVQIIYGVLTQIEDMIEVQGYQKHLQKALCMHCFLSKFWPSMRLNGLEMAILSQIMKTQISSWIVIGIQNIFIPKLQEVDMTLSEYTFSYFVSWSKISHYRFNKGDPKQARGPWAEAIST
jgi:hypothetical protein